MRLLITRPMPDAAHTDSLLRQMGHETLLAPLLQIETLPNVVIPDGPFSAVLITSANAARAVALHPDRSAVSKLPVFAVGAHTANAAYAIGFQEVIAGPGSASELLPLIRGYDWVRGSSLLYLAGEDRARDIAGDLRPYGITVHMVTVYRAQALAALPPAIVQALSTATLDGVLHYSARAAAAFIQCAGNADLVPQAKALIHYCMSARIADPLRRAGLHHVRVPKSPTEESLFALLGS